MSIVRLLRNKPVPIDDVLELVLNEMKKGNAKPLLTLSRMIAIKNNTIKEYARLIEYMNDEMIARTEERPLNLDDMSDMMKLLFPYGIREMCKITFSIFPPCRSDFIAPDDLICLCEQRFANFLRTIPTEKEEKASSSQMSETPAPTIAECRTAYENFRIFTTRLAHETVKFPLFDEAMEIVQRGPNDNIVTPRFLVKSNVEFNKLHVYRKTTWCDLYKFLMSRHVEHGLLIVDMHFEGSKRANVPVVYDTTPIEISSYGFDATNSTIVIHGYSMFLYVPKSILQSDGPYVWKDKVLEYLDSRNEIANIRDFESRFLSSLLLHQTNGPRVQHDGIGYVSSLLPCARLFYTRNGENERRVPHPQETIDDSFRLVDLFAIATEVLGVNPFDVFQRAGISIWFPFSDAFSDVRGAVKELVKNPERAFVLYEPDKLESVWKVASHEWCGSNHSHKDMPALLYGALCLDKRVGNERFFDHALSALDGSALFALEAFYGISGVVPAGTRVDPCSFRILQVSVQSSDVRSASMIMHPFFSAFPSFETSLQNAYEQTSQTESIECSACTEALFLALDLVNVHRIHRTYAKDQYAVTVKFALKESTPFTFTCGAFCQIVPLLVRCVQVNPSDRYSVYFVDADKIYRRVSDGELFYHYLTKGNLFFSIE